MLEVCAFIRSIVTSSVILKGLHAKPDEVSRYLSVAFNGFASDLSCFLALISLAFPGADCTGTTQKEPRWSYYKILSKYYRVLLFPLRG